MSSKHFDEALAVALEAHGGQVDRGKQPFILHPLRIMHEMETMDEKLVALLHDTVEDSSLTFVDLCNMAFPAPVLQAVEAITKRDGEDYLNEYICDRVYKVELARRVKVKDLEDNMNMSRLLTVTEKDLERVRKYKKAWDLLKS